MNQLQNPIYSMDEEQYYAQSGGRWDMFHKELTEQEVTKEHQKLTAIMMQINKRGF